MTDDQSSKGHNSQNLFARLGPIVYRAPATLKAYGNNPRKHSQKQVVKLAASIREFGFSVPVLADAKGVVVAGEGRWQAARMLELDSIPVITLDHLSASQVRAFRIADNKLAELSTWDREALAMEFQAIIEDGDVAIEATGFEIGEVDVLIEDARPNADPGGAVDPADVVPERQAAISRTGDLWLLGDHRLLCGSSRDAQTWVQLMGGRTAAMLFSDPPYNVAVNGHVSSTKRHAEFKEASGEMSRSEFTDFLAEALSSATSHLKDGGIADVCMDFRHIPELYAAAERCALSVLNLCVWNKTSGGMGSLYRSKHELVLIAKKGRAPHTNNVQLGRYGRYRTNVWDYAGANTFSSSRKADLADHPTCKPVALVADAIRDVTRPGEIVLDGFMGSGTTLLAAERTQRLGYGIEIEGGYVDVTIRRWQTVTGLEAILAATGETFTAVHRRRGEEEEASREAAAVLPGGSPSNVRHRTRAIAA